MRVLVIGGGGREHALVWKIKKSPLVREVFCAPGNAGVARIADCVAIDPSSIVELADFAQSIAADLTVVGPELPMSLGLGDELHRRGLLAFCPSKAAAEIEGSKAFAREFMKRHDIPSPRYAICETLPEALAFVAEGSLGFPLVVKADGLASGKGVFIAPGAREAKAAVEQIKSDRKLGTAGARIVFEECLRGEEVSFFALSDGARVLPLVSVQDHKRAYDRDQGPNTGGMGSVSPSTNLTMDLHRRILAEIVDPTIAGMAVEGRTYRGVLYAGLMLTDDGPKVLEFNARFGDPEAQAIVTRLESDIVPVLKAAAEGALGTTSLEWSKRASACIVLAAKGYPDRPETGQEIRGLEGAEADGVVVFHAGTALKNGRDVTAGGRVLGVTAVGPSLDEAVKRAYAAVSGISFDGMHYRKDIGAAALRHLHSA